MVDFLRKRLQVFISSTYSDLRTERQAAVEAILTAGHIPAGMELFTSGDESQMEVIKQWIDESDVYMLILGGRYGSVDEKSGKSYTRLEYEYALKKGKPLFSCVVTDQALERKIKEQGSVVIETANGAALKEFRLEVLSRMIRYWEDAKDIKIATGETLAQFSRRDDLVGWVRPAANEVDMNGLANEIARLSHENANLRERSIGSSEPLIQGFTFLELKELLERKGLLEFLWRNMPYFASELGMRADFAGVCKQLAFYGLLSSHSSIFDSFVLSPAGNIFLSRLELIMLRQGAV